MISLEIKSFRYIYFLTFKFYKQLRTHTLPHACLHMQIHAHVHTHANTHTTQS